MKIDTYMGVAGGQGRTGREVVYYGTSIALGTVVALVVAVVIVIVKVTQ